MSSTEESGSRGDVAFLLLYVAAAAALILGIYARFKGLSLASLEADEYFTIQSVQNILRFGIPAYECGGYYPRALAFQYFAALLQTLGLSGELAVRSLAAVCSLIALPGIYLLGKRIGGRAVGVAALAVLAVSLWEIEIARFGRMYAPFQAIVVWYLVYFLKLVVDGDQRALWPMLLLTVLGALTWEGGVFLPLANLLVPFFRNPSGRLSRSDWIYLTVNLALLVGAYVLSTANLRTIGTAPAFPADYDPNSVRMSSDVIDDTAPLWSVIDRHFMWALLGIVPIGLSLFALKWIWALRARWPAALALLAALGFALAHQFGAVAVVIIVALLLGFIRWDELAARAARPYVATILGLFLFWLAFGVVTSDWRGSFGASWLGDRLILWLFYELFRLPDVALQIGLPWMRAVPVLTLVLAVLLLVGVLRAITRSEDSQPAERAALLVLICMVAGVGLSDPPRHETRYVFFLYPLVVILAITATVHLVRAIRWHWPIRSAALIVLPALVLFAVTEDFRPQHLLTIDSAAALMRADLPSDLEGHIVPRSDVRGAAQWLAQQAKQTPRPLLINAFPSADYYFPNFDFTYIDRNHQRFRAFACRRGTVERWGNLPLVSTLPELENRIAQAGRAFMVVSRRDATTFTNGLASWNPRVVWAALDGQIEILSLGSTGGGR